MKFRVKRGPYEGNSRSISYGRTFYIGRDAAGSPTNQLINTGQSRSSSLLQWLTLTRRYGQVMIRDQKNLILLLLQPLIIAALIGFLFLNYAPVFEKSPYQTEELIITEAVRAAYSD